MDADFRVGQWLVQPQLNLIQGPGGDTPLEPKAMEVLVCLSQQAGEVVPKERLMQTVWSDTFVTDEVLTNSIWELRKAFGDDAKKPKVIQTVFKKGYRLIAPVSFEGKATEVRSILKQSQPESAARSRRPSAGRWIGVAGALLAVTLGIAFSLRSLRQVETVPSEAPRVVPLTSFPGREIQPTFSPDGNQVAFAWNGEKEENFDIYVKLIGSEKLLHLTNDPSVELSPAWSPDGKSIAFIRHSQTHTSIILIPALGGLERELYSVEAWALPVQALQRLLSWSPDGKLLAVCEPAMAKQKQRARISLLSMETRVSRVLVSSDTPVLAYWNPNFSPDGRALAYVASTSPTVGNIHSVPLAGGEPRQLTSRNRRISGFDWLGNGRGLLFAETQALWKIPVAGGRPEQLNWAGSQVFSPAVSRNGNSLVFERGLVDVNIWKLEVVGTSSSPEKRTPLISSTYLDDHPQLSPDGKKIAFASTRSGDPEIWVCEADGSGQFRLTSIGAHDTATPRWSPDGRSIAFHSNLNGNLDIYVVSLGSGELRRSTTEASDEVRPSWSKNGRWIYFGSNRSGEWQVWKVPAAGGQAEQVTKRGGREAFESLDGKFVCYTKFFVIPELWRVPAEGGDEVLLLHGPRQGYWAPVNDGICFLANEPTSIIKLYNFGTKLTTELATVEKPIPWGGSGFSVSPDGKQILYSQIDRTLETDLMLVENFH